MNGIVRGSESMKEKRLSQNRPSSTATQYVLFATVLWVFASVHYTEVNSEVEDKDD